MKSVAMHEQSRESAAVRRGTGCTLVLPTFLTCLALSAPLPRAQAEPTAGTGCLSSSSAQANGPSSNPSISADGRFVAFYSRATNLVAGDTNEHGDVFVRDRQRGITERVSVDASGAQGNGDSGYFCLSISADGRYVAFYSFASNLVPGDTNGHSDVFVRDRRRRTTERVSVDSRGAQGNGDSGYFCLSILADGRHVAFDSSATNFAPRHGNQSNELFVRDRQTGTTERVNVDSTSAWCESHRRNASSSTSVDGRCVAFESYATDLVGGDDDGSIDIFVRDRSSATTERVSVDSVGTRGDNHSSCPSISADGRCVAFQSLATNLVPGDTNGFVDVFVRDRQSGTIERVSVGLGRAR